MKKYIAILGFGVVGSGCAEVLAQSKKLICDRLGFEIDGNTMAAIEKKAPLAKALAAERVRDETEKIMLTAAPDRVFELVRFGLLDAFLLKRAEYSQSFAALRRIIKKPLERWVLLALILKENNAINSVESFLTSMRLDSRTIRCGEDAGSIVENAMPESPYQWKKLLNRYGVASVSCAVRCYDALHGGKKYNELKAVLKSGECFSVKHLAIGGDELLELGLRGRELGDMLAFLLDYVMEYPENNRPEVLLSLAGASED